MTRFSRLGPDERRAQILTAARRLFSERSYAAVSMGDIAAEAGVARGLLHHYFGAKRDLYVEVVREVVRLPPPPLPPAAPGREAGEVVAESVDAWLRMIERDRGTWLAAIGTEALRDPEVERLIDAAAEEMTDRVLLVLGRDRAAPGERAAVRSYGAMAQAATREWLERGRMTRAQVHALLTGTLLALAGEVMPRLAARPS